MFSWAPTEYELTLSPEEQSRQQCTSLFWKQRKSSEKYNSFAKALLLTHCIQPLQDASYEFQRLRYPPSVLCGFLARLCVDFCIFLFFLRIFCFLLLYFQSFLFLFHAVFPVYVHIVYLRASFER